MTAKQALLELIDEISEEEARRLLEFYQSEEEHFTEEEIQEILEAREEMERGEYVDWDELKAKHGL